MCVLLLHRVLSFEGNCPGRLLFFVGFMKGEGHNFQDKVKEEGNIFGTFHDHM